MDESSLPSSLSQELDERQFGRLRWRCRRGLLELDLLLKNFLERHYTGLTPLEQQAFERMLATPDQTLLAYVTGEQNPPESELMNIIAKIKQ